MIFEPIPNPNWRDEVATIDAEELVKQMKDNTISSGSDVIAVLCSGGIDSTALIGYVLSEGDIPLIINIDYGAANNWAEAKAVEQVKHWYIQRGYTMRALGLTIDNMVMFAEQVSRDTPDLEFDQIGKDNPTIFPGRNALLISMAAAAALARNIKVLYAGMAQHDEEANFPDCSQRFLIYLKDALYTGYKMLFITPFWHRTRAEVIREAYKYKVPLHLTYSCYRGGPTHCGKCPACYSRRQSFMDAGFIDPTTYAQMPPKVPGVGCWEEWNVQDW